jgi:hypothetical protein
MQIVMDNLRSMEPYSSKHMLKEYDSLLMYPTIIETKHQSMELVASNINVKWHLHDVL